MICWMFIRQNVRSSPRRGGRDGASEHGVRVRGEGGGSGVRVEALVRWCVRRRCSVRGGRAVRAGLLPARARIDRLAMKWPIMRSFKRTMFFSGVRFVIIFSGFYRCTSLNFSYLTSPSCRNSWWPLQRSFRCIGSCEWYFLKKDFHGGCARLACCSRVQNIWCRTRL